MASPIAYLRRSRVDADNPGTISHETQLTAVRELAKTHGDTEPYVLEDWGRSGRDDRTHLRTEYAELKRRIEAGEVSTLYGYSLSRLTRSARETLDLFELCKQRGVPIRLAKDNVDEATVIGRMAVGMLAVFNQAQVEWDQERAADAIAVRRARGDILGRKPYGSVEGESVEDVLAAFKDAGTYLGTAKLLNERSVPARLGKGWSIRTVSRIVKREAPHLVGPPGRQGAPARATRVFSGLLICHCGETLTSMPSKWSTRYYCRKAHNDKRHSRPYVVSERKLLRAAMHEAGRLLRPDKLSIAIQSSTKHFAIESRFERFTEMYGEGVITHDRLNAERQRRDKDIGELDATETLTNLPPIDWQAAGAALYLPNHPEDYSEQTLTDLSLDHQRIYSAIMRQTKDIADLNTLLRTLWTGIKLGPDMLPRRFEWRVPSLRRD